MEKQRWEESERRRKEVRISEKRKSEKKEDAGARKGRKVAIHCVFPMICGSGGSKSRPEAAGAEPSGEMRDEHLHLVIAHHSRTTFRSCDVEKVHAVVARSTFASEKAKSTPFSDHFWKLRCRKCARRSSAKHVSKSKVQKKRFRSTFRHSDVVLRGKRKEL